MDLTINSLPKLEEFATTFLTSLSGSEKHATVVGLSGDLGSGKTAFTKAVAKALGIAHEVLSPTFVLAKYYSVSGSPHFSRMIHMDLYRISDERELRAIRFSELLREPHTLILVEWPENAGALLPGDTPTLYFEFVNESTRKVRDHAELSG